MELIDWTDAFENGAYIPGAEEIAAGWGRDAAAFRAATPPRTLRYGDGARQIVDLYLPEGAPRGLAVFVHGGYWHSRAPQDFAHLAAGALARGWAVAQPGYTLAPEARIAGIGREVARAVELAASAVAGPIRLSGHSAGGHLVARLACAGALDPGVAARIAHVLPISGIFDLAPLTASAMNAKLQLDAAEAAAESPALLEPSDAPMTLWVGAAERPEFLRQTRLMGEARSRSGRPAAEIYAPGLNHFTVIAGLADPASDIVTTWLETNP
ncbi:alpha/beta hydrolase [Wenxinia saemankumensis]|uniref:Acetyl esterase/lipase n=1 Tax=Wenxinia saemankumensis TaxID=1447782 RepID=A0A1M6AAC3_9RHOB|nr:alpha/beta hydrolase [Wenxinia saemankumensis]SHI33367.1 Acetyl esterase/lipase [Wenxinia saemankumensis]